MVSIRTALALLVGLNTLSPVASAGVDGSLPEARLTWRLGFGDAGQPLQTGYGLTVGYRGLDGAPAEQLLELDVSDQATLARLAGLPLFQRDYRARQNDGGTTAEAGSRPWYARRWVLWTAGGLAASLAAVGGGGGDNTVCTGVCNQDSGPSGRTTGITYSDGDVYAGCVDGQCVVCPDGSVASRCLVGMPSRAMVTTDPERDRWLDAGTGHMGDLIAR